MVFAQNAPFSRGCCCWQSVAVDLDALQLGNPRFGDSDDRTQTATSKRHNVNKCPD
jgi:hypothetical protein